jgi:hypothetical protein
MGNACSIDEERETADRAEVVIRDLTSGTVTDADATRGLRAVRLCATRVISSLSAGAAIGSRHEIALASLDLIEALKRPGPRDQKIERALSAVEAWKRQLAAM